MTSHDVPATLSLLEARLNRLEFLLESHSDDDETTHGTRLKPPLSDDTVAVRIQKLEHDFNRLTSKSVIAQDLLRLSTRHPELFLSDDSRSPTTGETSTMASIVLAHASSFPETASRLSSLQTLPIPEARASTRLIALKPRADKAMEENFRQETEVAELRARSARLIEWWVNIGIVGMGECWADWEGRLRECERNATQLERRLTLGES